jgi:FAD dependent oxidoreductase
MLFRHFDTVVLGAGCAGVAAAVSAARNGARTALVDGASMIGGELLSGMTIDGAINASGEWVNGGIVRDLVRECDRMGGYVGQFSDWRLIHYACYDPEIMKIAVARTVQDAGVTVFLHSFAEDVAVEDGRVKGLIVHNRGGKTFLSGDVFIDCSGDGDLCVKAGAPFEKGGEDGELQPVSIMFRMSGVDTEPLLAFVRDHPEYVAVGESEAIRGGRTDRQLVEEIYNQGQPCVFFKGDGPLLAEAMATGEMYPTALIMIEPTSSNRKEVCINSTRVSGVTGTQSDQMGNAMADLLDQARVCSLFLQRRVPGFANAFLSGTSPRVGIRETVRVMGEEILTDEDAITGRKRDDGIARGCHHIDIHELGVGQVRIPVADGGSYDIPFGALVPKKLKNVLMAGRCFSATRPAHGSARVMGSCMAMGQAAGVAAAIWLQSNRRDDMREIPAARVRARLREQGAILDGTR